MEISQRKPFVQLIYANFKTGERTMGWDHSSVASTSSHKALGLISSPAKKKQKRKRKERKEGKKRKKKKKRKRK
jgi:hypothetical protein